MENYRWQLRRYYSGEMYTVIGFTLVDEAKSIWRQHGIIYSFASMEDAFRHIHEQEVAMRQTRRELDNTSINQLDSLLKRK